MKLGGEIKTGRLSVRDECKFVNARTPLPAREACKLDRLFAGFPARRIRALPLTHPSAFPSISLDSRRLGSLTATAVLE
jgi:hypothetical protein